MDLHERLDHLNDDIMHIGDAIDAIESIDGCQNIVDILDDIKREKEVMREYYHSQIEANDDRDDDDIMADYWRDAI